MGVRQGAAGARGGPGDVRARPTAGSRPPTGSSGSCAGAEMRNACTAGYKGDLPGRRTTRPRTTCARSTRASRVRRRKLETRSSELGERAGCADRQAAGWTGLPEGIAVAVGNVDAHVTAARRAARSSPARWSPIMGTSTCHVMNGDDAGRGAGHVRRRRRRHRAGPVGLRGRAERRRRHLRLVRRQLVPPRVPRRGARARASTCTSTCPSSRPRQRVGQHGLVALDWHSGNRSVLVDHELSGADRRADAGHAAGGHLPRADGGDRVRHARDHRRVRGGGRARRGADRRRRPDARTPC